MEIAHVVPGMGVAVRPSIIAPREYQEFENKQMPWVRAYRRGSLAVFVSIESDHWHMSISHPTRYPTWDEIKTARYGLCPKEITMVMFLPPQDEYVNVHANCFHLHEIRRGEE